MIFQDIVDAATPGTPLIAFPLANAVIIYQVRQMIDGNGWKLGSRAMSPDTLQQLLTTAPKGVIFGLTAGYNLDHPDTIRLFQTLREIESTVPVVVLCTETPPIGLMTGCKQLDVSIPYTPIIPSISTLNI